MTQAATVRILAVGDPFMPAGAFTRALATLGDAVMVAEFGVEDATPAAPSTTGAIRPGTWT